MRDLRRALLVLVLLLLLLWLQDRRIGDRTAPLTWETCEAWRIDCR